MDDIQGRIQDLKLGVAQLDGKFEKKRGGVGVEVESISNTFLLAQNYYPDKDCNCFV